MQHLLFFIWIWYPESRIRIKFLFDEIIVHQHFPATVTTASPHRCRCSSRLPTDSSQSSNHHVTKI